MDRGASQLPRRAALDSVKLSWRAVARLGPDEFVDSRELYKRLLAEITTFLEAKWRQIIAALDAVRDGEKFKKQWALQGLLPIAGPPKPIASVLNPLSRIRHYCGKGHNSGIGDCRADVGVHNRWGSGVRRTEQKTKVKSAGA